ncbi:DUF3231 family protein [Priestia filamentosa]|uniref:DUF3231 family protein n=1 Tax=Priestia filamentosa TaxID=1402861 RepID=UPI0027E341A6|nr:DUF3231 family protein [Priestia filamentosa]
MMKLKTLLNFALKFSRKHVKEIQDIFETENIPIPVGFGEQDIRKDAPRLFSDIVHGFLHCSDGKCFCSDLWKCLLMYNTTRHSKIFSKLYE